MGKMIFGLLIKESQQKEVEFVFLVFFPSLLGVFPI